MRQHAFLKTLRKSVPVLGIVAMITGCAGSQTQREPAEVWEISAGYAQPFNGEAEILQSWQGDYPVTQFELLPEKHREQAVGFVDDAGTFEEIWQAFKPRESIPEIDFNKNLVLFTRNTRFYNRISIGKVNVTDGIAEVLAMETMSAMPIEDKVAMSLVVVLRLGILAIQTGDKIVSVDKAQE